MAQTKRKRQTKHRGNAAGEVEVRGRTGRKPTAAEKSGNPREAAKAKAKPLDKRDQPPTWRSAFIRGMVAGIIFMLFLIVLLNQSKSAIGWFPVVIAGYTVVTYYSDRFIYRRRQLKKAKGGAGK